MFFPHKFPIIVIWSNPFLFWYGFSLATFLLFAANLFAKHSIHYPAIASQVKFVLWNLYNSFINSPPSSCNSFDVEMLLYNIGTLGYPFLSDVNCSHQGATLIGGRKVWGKKIHGISIYLAGYLQFSFLPEWKYWVYPLYKHQGQML